MTLGAFNQSPEVEAFYATVAPLVVVGSRLRSNETRTYRLGLEIHALSLSMTIDGGIADCQDIPRLHR